MSFDSLAARRIAETDRTAARRSEAVMRILKDRSTVVEEAVRLGVDVDTMARWFHATLAAIHRTLVESETAPLRQAA